MSDLDSDLQIEFEGLEYEIQVAKDRLRDYSNRHFNTQREDVLIFCLKRAIELSDGCVLCAKANLYAPLNIIARGLLESLIWVCWITKSNENAKIFVDATRNELKRQARKQFNTGHGRAVDEVTGEDKTKELLNSDWAKDISSRLKIVDAAKSVGLDKLYTQMYGFMSLTAHGLMLETNTELKEDLLGDLAIANVLMECINLVVKNWIIDRKQTPAKDIYAILQ